MREQNSCTHTHNHKQNRKINLVRRARPPFCLVALENRKPSKQAMGEIIWRTHTHTLSSEICCASCFRSVRFHSRTRIQSVNIEDGGTQQRTWTFRQFGPHQAGEADDCPVEDNPWPTGRIRTTINEKPTKSKSLFQDSQKFKQKS